MYLGCSVTGIESLPAALAWLSDLTRRKSIPCGLHAAVTAEPPDSGSVSYPYHLFSIGIDFAIGERLK